MANNLIQAAFFLGVLSGMSFLLIWDAIFDFLESRMVRWLISRLKPKEPSDE